MDQFSEQIEGNSQAKELAALIRLEDCNKNPDQRGSSVTDYEIYRTFIAILSEFPEMLAEVMKGQILARENETYDHKPGILVYETTGHAHFLRQALQCIESILEFPRYAAGKSIYVNPTGLSIFKYQYNKSLIQVEPSTEDSFWLTLAEKLAVTDMMLGEIDTHLDKSAENGRIQQQETLQRSLQASINPISEV